jgi:XTP/dITP diphosphohydrolase
VATRNRGKQAEFRVLLAGLGRELLFPDDLGLTEDPAEDGLEEFDTFAANATAKAHWFARRSGLTTLADDSGVVVDALHGAPGVHSRRFAGQVGPDHVVAAANNAELLRRLESVAEADRSARYYGVLVLSEWDVNSGEFRDLVAEGVTEGRILTASRGTGGFGYDPLFWSSELHASFGEVSAAVKDTVSHRARAAAVLVDIIRRGERLLDGIACHHSGGP